MRRISQRFGTVLLVLGALTLAYAAATYFWRDPVTDLYAKWKQHGLDSALTRQFDTYRAPKVDWSRRLVAERAVARAAAAYDRQLKLGQPIGRIAIPKLHIHPVFVHGTRWAQDLSRGPGHYVQTSLPGLGKTTAIAGHRTTFGAWFRHIDELERGNAITLELPYGLFRYVVFGHKVVKSNDWSIIRQRGFDELVLSACHPLYSASHRWVVFARLVSVRPAGSRVAYTVAGRTPASVQAAS
jgi:sortase A